jgi:hypothetical protein
MYELKEGKPFFPMLSAPYIPFPNFKFRTFPPKWYNLASCDLRTIELLINCLPYVYEVFDLISKQCRTVFFHCVPSMETSCHVNLQCHIWQSPGNIYPGSDLDMYGNFFGNIY